MSNRFLPNHPLSANELLIIPEAFYELLIARLKVSILKSEQYLPSQKSKKEARSSPVTFEKIDAISTVINGLSIRTPWRSTCLVKVMATHKMLLKRHVQHILHFGVQKNSSIEIKAHAWLSVGSKIIVGGENSEGFTEISQIAS